MEVSIARIDFSFLLATSKQLAEKQEEPGRRREGRLREALARGGSGSHHRTCLLVLRRPSLLQLSPIWLTPGSGQSSGR